MHVVTPLSFLGTELAMKKTKLLKVVALVVALVSGGAVALEGEVVFSEDAAGNLWIQGSTLADPSAASTGDASDVIVNGKSLNDQAAVVADLEQELQTFAAAFGAPKPDPIVLPLNCSSTYSSLTFLALHLSTAKSVSACCCPGLRKVTTVLQSVHLDSSSSHANLMALHTVHGDIDSGTGSSETAKGSLNTLSLENLAFVGGSVLLSRNDITTLSFESLTAVGGTLDLSSNRLGSVRFEKLQRVGGDLLFTENRLEALDLANITSVGGSVQCSRNPLSSLSFGALHSLGKSIICNKAALSTLNFANISAVPGYLQFYGSGVERVDFGAITSVEGGVALDSNQLTAISFANLERIGTGVSLAQNSISSVDFGRLTLVSGSINLQSNSLTSLNFGNSLTKVTGFVDLSQNPFLTSIDFGALQELYGLTLVSNDLTALHMPAPVRMDLLHISGCPLTELDLANVTGAMVGIALSSNDLRTFRLGGVSRVNASVAVTNNQLTSLSFGALTAIGQGLDLSGNRLRSISFQGLSSVGSDVDLSNNQLTAVDLSSPITIAGVLDVTGNPTLTELECTGVTFVNGGCVRLTASDTTPTQCPICS